MKITLVTAGLVMAAFGVTTTASAQSPAAKAAPFRLVTLDPGHFHAALVQKNMYPTVDPTVYVYAPDGPDVGFHLDRIRSYNARKDNPTRWQEKLYTGPDFMAKMLAERPGNVVVMAGNNGKKTEYIRQSVGAGLHVLADKPMAIDGRDFDLLRQSFAVAAKKNVLLYDIMTERFEITTMLQREFSRLPAVFGTLEKGTPDNPAITKESVHHFYKYVSGSVLTRPAWFMDVTQQGEGIVDVTTHLVDLVQWEAFPEQVLDYRRDVRLTSARRWTTDMSRAEFQSITKLPDFPEYLKKDVQNDVLKVYSNGEINYQLRGVHARVSVIWAFKAPEGAGDTHYSIMRGTKANLVIRQGAEQQYKPTLYVEAVGDEQALAASLTASMKAVEQKYPGVTLKKLAKGWQVMVPESYNEGHEAHFGRVMENYLKYLSAGKLPAWEVPNMLTKYYTTTRALELARQSAAAGTGN